MDCHGRHFPTGSDQKPSEVSFIHSRAAFLMQLQHGTHFYNYHMSNSHECTVVNGETLQLHTVYRKKKRVFFFFLLHVTWEPVSVLQVPWQSVSSIKYYKSRVCVWTCNEIESSYDKIIITIVPSHTRKNITHLFPLTLLLVLRTGNNIDGNKHMISSGIALYYGDTFTRGTWHAASLTQSKTWRLQTCS